MATMLCKNKSLGTIKVANLTSGIKEMVFDALEGQYDYLSKFCDDIRAILPPFPR